MQFGRSILLDLFLNFIVNGSFLSVNNLFYSLAVFVLAGNFSGNGNGLEVVFLAYCHSDQAFSDLADLFCLCLGSNDFAVLNQSGNLASDQCFSLVCSSAKFSITCHYSFPPFVEHQLMLFGLT